MAVDLVELVDQRQGKRFLCTQDVDCQKSFTRKSDLLRHERIHTGEKPYGCANPKCGKSFRQQSALNVHSRTHTGEKPFVCKFADCGKRFADSSSLSRHHKSNTHGGKTYSCKTKDCGKTFARKNSLRRHLERCGNTLHVLSSAQIPQPDEGEMDSSCAAENIASEAAVVAMKPQASEIPHTPSHSEQSHAFTGIDYAKQHHSMPWDAAKNGPVAWSQAPATGLALATDVVDYGVIVPGQDMARFDHLSNPQDMRRVAESNTSRIFIAEQGNPGIATMNTNAIPHSYFASGQPDYPQAPTDSSGAMASPIHQSRVCEYTTGQDDACMSATSSFHGRIEEDCFSPHSTHSAATSFCEVSSPNPSGHFDPHYYAHQLPQQAAPVPSPMSFGPLIIESHHDHNTGFPMPSYHCQPYV